MSDFSFEPKSKCFNDMFSQSITYKIPEYQRPYAWYSSRNKSEQNQKVTSLTCHVDQLWEDVISAFTAFNDQKNSSKQTEYFLGSIILTEESSRAYQIVDGQQRLTTFVLFFGAFRNLLEQIQKENPNSNLSPLLNKIESLLFDYVEDENTFEQTKKLKIFRSIPDYEKEKFDINEALLVAIEGKKLKEQVLQETPEEYKEMVSYYFGNVEFFQSMMKTVFQTTSGLTEEKRRIINRFYSFVSNNIFLVQIITKNLDAAYIIFETLNNRGMPLENKDLFKNFIIREFSKKIENPVVKWNHIQSEFTINDEFFAAWLESKTGYEIERLSFPFRLIQKIYEGHYKSDIFRFYNEISKDLRNYTFLLSPNSAEDEDQKRIKNRIAFLRFLDKEGRITTGFLLALFRWIENVESDNTFEVLEEIISLLESFLVYYVLIPGKKIPKDRIYGAITSLNTKTININEARKQLTLTNEDKLIFISLIQGKLTNNNHAKILLAKYLWSRTSKIKDVVDLSLSMESATLEHIIPQSPEERTNWLDQTKYDSAFIRDITYKLGNMTLLTKGLNSSLKNAGWEVKQSAYRNETVLPLTLEIVGENLDSNDKEKNHKVFLERQERITKFLLDSFGLKDSETNKKPETPKATSTAKSTIAADKAAVISRALPDSKNTFPAVTLEPINSVSITTSEAKPNLSARSITNFESLNIPERVKPRKLLIQGKEFAVSSWRDVFLKSITFLSENKPEQYKNLFKDERLQSFFALENMSIYFTSPRLIPSPSNTKSKAYVETNRNTKTLMAKLRLVFEICEIPLPSTLVETEALA